MSQQTYPENTDPCEIYMGRSSWDFFRDCHSRVAAAENYARKLGRHLYEAQVTAYQSQLALAECEKSRAASLEALNNERVHHRACQEALSAEIWKHREALSAEIWKHREAVDFIHRFYKEAFQNAESAESLAHETPGLNSFPIQTAQGITSPAECDASTTARRQPHSIQRIINHD